MNYQDIYSHTQDTKAHFCETNLEAADSEKHHWLHQKYKYFLFLSHKS